LLLALSVVVLEYGGSRTDYHCGAVAHLSQLVFKDPDSCVEELSLVLSQCNDPLLPLELGVAGHQKLLADLSSLEYDLECILSLGSLYIKLVGSYRFSYLFIYFFDVEIVEGVEFSWVVITILLSVEVNNTSIGNDAELLRPFISLEHALGALPN
jgi:hypothetical protein